MNIHPATKVWSYTIKTMYKRSKTSQMHRWQVVQRGNHRASKVWLCKMTVASFYVTMTMKFHDLGLVSRSLKFYRPQITFAVNTLYIFIFIVFMQPQFINIYGFSICYILSAAQPIYEHHVVDKTDKESQQQQNPDPNDHLQSYTESIELPSTVDMKTSVKKWPLHMTPKQITSESRRFKCPRCGKDYSQRKNMRRHYRLECGQEPKYPCPVCGARFKRHNQMSGHMVTRHGMRDATNNKVILRDGAFEI